MHVFKNLYTMNENVSDMLLMKENIVKILFKAN